MRTHARQWVTFSFAILIIGLAGVAAAGTPAWISAPSVQYVGQMAEVNGGGLTAGATVTVKLTDPIGIVYSQKVTVAPDGSITYTVPLARAGHYKAEVFSSKGSRLAATLFGVATPPGQ